MEESEDERKFMKSFISNWDDLDVEVKQHVLETKYKARLHSSHARTLGERRYDPE